MTAARTFLSEWTLRLPLLSGNPGSSGKFSVLFFSVAEDYLLPLSGVSWKETFILCFTKLLVDRFISQVMACVMELFINFPEFILYRFQVLSGSCKSYCFNVEILICGDYAVAVPFKMPSNTNSGVIHWYLCRAVSSADCRAFVLWSASFVSKTSPPVWNLLMFYKSIINRQGIAIKSKQVERRCLEIP